MMVFIVIWFQQSFISRSTSRRNYIEDSDSDSEVRSTEHKFKKKGSYKLQKGSKTKNTENSKNISESFVASSESFLQNTSRSYSLRSNRSCLLSQGLPTHYKRFATSVMFSNI